MSDKRDILIITLFILYILLLMYFCGGCTSTLIEKIDYDSQGRKTSYVRYKSEALCADTTKINGRGTVTPTTIDVSVGESTTHVDPNMIKEVVGSAVKGALLLAAPVP